MYSKNGERVLAFCKYDGKLDGKKLENNIILNSNYKNKLENILTVFINLYKSGNRRMSDFLKFEKMNRENNMYDQKKRHRLFLKLAQNTIREYKDTLIKKSRVDFHDMINLATYIVKKKGIYPYKYIIIDEYQDTSLQKNL